MTPFQFSPWAPPKPLAKKLFTVQTLFSHFGLDKYPISTAPGGGGFSKIPTCRQLTQMQQFYLPKQAISKIN
jgi:hypothetical protein